MGNLSMKVIRKLKHVWLGSGSRKGKAAEAEIEQFFKKSTEKKCIISGSVPGKGGKAAGA